MFECRCVGNHINICTAAEKGSSRTRTGWRVTNMTIALGRRRTCIYKNCKELEEEKTNAAYVQCISFPFHNAVWGGGPPCNYLCARNLSHLRLSYFRLQQIILPADVQIALVGRRVCCLTFLCSRTPWHPKVHQSPCPLRSPRLICHNTLFRLIYWQAAAAFAALSVDNSNCCIMHAQDSV